MIYIIVGQSGSGKTSARLHLEGRGFQGFEASSYVKGAMKKYGVKSVEELLMQQGRDISARLIHEDMGVVGDKNGIVITGFRVPEEIKYFKNRFETKVIGLYTNPLNSFVRIISERRSGRSDNPENFEKFFRGKICGDNLLGLSKIMRDYLDIFLVNEGSLDKLLKDIDVIIGVS